ncbi:MAG: glycosyltransferase [Proteobacteria bacterium]|nr:glycosyltransferase [Pseudomonadota bacterium]
MKICVLTARYSVSGVPLAQIRLANALRRRGACVDVLFGNAGIGSACTKEIEGLVDLRVRRTFLMLPAIMRYLRTERPDVVFSAEDHLNAITLLAAILTGSRSRICCSSRVTPLDTYGRGSILKRLVLKSLIGMVSRRAQLLTCVSEDMIDQYRGIFGDEGRVCVYNIIDPVLSGDLISENVDHPWFSDPGSRVVVAAGSLEPWKGFADLIRAITVTHDDVKLMILGEGSQRSNLEELIGSLGLTDRVQLVGQVRNPLAYFSKARVFALSSHVEGMPNVLIEAMMCGCTPVSTNCPTGPRELLEGKDYGSLVPVEDWAALGRAINQGFENPAPYDWLMRIIEPFSEACVIERYQSLLDLRFPLPDATFGEGGSEAKVHS